MLTLYGSPKTRSFRVLWLMEELQIPYEYTHINPLEAHKNETFVKLNPAAKIPVLADGDFVLSESAAILNYLVDQYPEKNLAPQHGTQARGLYDQWSYFALAELEQPLWLLAKHTFALPVERRMEGVEKTAFWEFEQAADLLASRLQASPYIAGEAFSAADILITHTLVWAQVAKAPMKHDIFKTYCDQNFARAGYQRAVEKDAE